MVVLSMDSKIGPILGLIGSIIALAIGCYVLIYVAYYSYFLIRIVGNLIIGSLGVVGSILGYKEKRNLSGILLIIAGGAVFFGFIFGYYMFFFYPFIEAFLMIIGGILVIVLEDQVSIDKEEISKLIMERKVSKGKKIRALFIFGSIIIGLVLLVIWLGMVVQVTDIWSSLYMYLGIPGYIFGIFLIALGCQLIGNKWIWLDVPITLVFCIISIFFTYRVVYAFRVLGFFIFPLNFGVFLVFYILAYRKALSEGVVLASKELPSKLRIEKQKQSEV